MICPAVSPPPAGYRIWNPSVDGPVPASAVAVASSLAFSSAAYDTTEGVCAGGVPLLVRVDPHTQSTDASGQPITGCFHGATVYRPTDPSTPCSGDVYALSSSWSTGEKVLALAGAAGAALGLVALARAWRRR